MPPGNPSHQRGYCRFINSEYLVIAYASEPQTIRAMVREPWRLTAAMRCCTNECIREPECWDFGSQTESGVVIPCTYNGEAVIYTRQMYLDDEPPITAGREIWGLPKRYGYPKLETMQHTLTGTLHYAGERVALGTMVYKHERACGDLDQCKKALEKTQVHLKLIPCVTGHSKVEQMVACDLSQIRLKDFWIAPARLHLTRYVNALVADLPVKRVIGGKHSAPISPCPMAGSCTTILTEAPT